MHFSENLTYCFSQKFPAHHHSEISRLFSIFHGCSTISTIFHRFSTIFSRVFHHFSSILSWETPSFPHLLSTPELFGAGAELFPELRLHGPRDRSHGNIIGTLDDKKIGMGIPQFGHVIFQIMYIYILNMNSFGMNRSIYIFWNYIYIVL